MESNNEAASLFFIILIAIGTLVLLNLLLAVMVDCCHGKDSDLIALQQALDAMATQRDNLAKQSKGRNRSAEDYEQFKARTIEIAKRLKKLGQSRHTALHFLYL